MKKERQLYLKDLIVNILVRWKFLLIMMIVFGLFMEGYYYMNVRQPAGETSKTDQKATIEQTEKALTRFEKERADVSVQLYHTYMDAYAEMTEYMEQDDPEILETKSILLMHLIDTGNKWNTMYNGFSEKQKAYVDAVLAAEYDEKEQDVTGEEIVKVSAFSKKYTLLGMIFGIFIAVCWIAFRYATAGTLYCEREAKEYHGLQVLGQVDIRPGRSEMGKKIRGLTNCGYEEQFGLISAAVDLIVKKNEIRRVLVVGSYPSSWISKIAEDLTVELKEIDFESGKSILTDPASIEMLAKTDAVIIVETIQKSKTTDITCEINICKANDVPVIGAIVLQED